MLKTNNIYYDIIPTINLLNVYNTTNIYEYFHHNYSKECKFNYLRFPKFQSIVNLPDKIKNEIIVIKDLNSKLKKEKISISEINDSLKEIIHAKNSNEYKNYKVILKKSSIKSNY